MLAKYIFILYYLSTLINYSSSKLQDDNVGWDKTPRSDTWQLDVRRQRFGTATLRQRKTSRKHLKNDCNDVFLSFVCNA